MKFAIGSFVGENTTGVCFCYRSDYLERGIGALSAHVMRFPLYIVADASAYTIRTRVIENCLRERFPEREKGGQTARNHPEQCIGNSQKMGDKEV